MFYDSLLLIALWFIATLLLLPFTQGEAVKPENPYYQLYLLTVTFLFFGWFWTHGGQTLGMRAWRFHVQQADGNTITWPQALIRFIGAIISWLCAGLGFIWILFDGENQAWHDKLSKTYLVMRPKR